jgi:hypothetical protein
VSLSKKSLKFDFLEISNAPIFLRIWAFAFRAAAGFVSCSENEKIFIMRRFVKNMCQLIENETISIIGRLKN